jgi:hypothetical protein
LAILAAVVGAVLAAGAQGEALSNEEHGVKLALPDGWEPIPMGEIPAEGRTGLIFAVRWEAEGATFIVKATGRDARDGEGERYAQFLKRRGGIADDGPVVVGGAEGWRVVRVTEENGQPLVRSTVFLPQGGKLYMLTGNRVGSSDPAAVSVFDAVEAALTFEGTGASGRTLETELGSGVRAALPDGWRRLDEGEISQLLPESFGQVESAYFSPGDDWLFYLSHVGGTGVIAGLDDLNKIGDDFQTQLDGMAGAHIISRRDEPLAGRPAHRMIYEIASADGGKVYETRALTSRDGQLLFMGGLALRGSDSSALDVFDPILASVQIAGETFAKARPPSDLAVPGATAAPASRGPAFPEGRGLFPRVTSEEG